MANRFFSPNQQFEDTTGLPYAGGSLTFYASGTSTPLATFSNRALTIPNLNPVILDSAGRAGDIFLQNLAYKVVLASDALGLVPIWTADPVYASDFSTVASLASGAGSPNGVVAGSQGSPTVNASVYWDTTNNILYVCTTTGTTLTAVWTAVNASTAAAVVLPPQGYLTLTSGTAIITGDVVSATSVYYTPYIGGLVPIYNGSSFVPTVFTELQLALVASHAAGNIYDVFVFNNSGVPTVVTGPSWAAGSGGSLSAGACARGSGAGSTSLSRVSGLWTNAVQITGRNGATTYTINANLATYVGSIYMDGTNGQVSCHRSYGQSRKWGVWNTYNRVPIYLKGGDGLATWAYGGGTRPANNNTANSLIIFSGLPEEIADLATTALVTSTPTTTLISSATAGIGFNSTTAFSGKIGQVQFNNGTPNPIVLINPLAASFKTLPPVGINVITALENGAVATVQMNWSGGENFFLLSAQWRG